MLKSLASCASSLASSPCMVGGALSVPNLFDAAAADDDVTLPMPLQLWWACAGGLCSARVGSAIMLAGPIILFLSFVIL